MNTVVFIIGPTGVGKTELSLLLGQKIPIEIINGDTGQFYEPLTIGTAKPAWRTESIPHHLFDHKIAPENYTAVAYRAAVQDLISAINARGALPVIVGGSLFYSRTLFYPIASLQPSSTVPAQEYSWNLLNDIDPQRARDIHPHDTYRWQRALTLWHTTGILPSQQKPIFDPLCKNMFIIYCTRQRDDLYTRINDRVHELFARGWLDEVAGLNEAWKAFVKVKKIIGYADIIAYQEGTISYAELITLIQQKTRHYAKQQETAWRSFKKEIMQYESVAIQELDLTLSSVHLYIDQLLPFLMDSIYDKKTR